jgi:Tol biopolymer transport system component/tRNA A-37 threonylcarbamoyl transferase component Bud32
VNHPRYDPRVSQGFRFGSNSQGTAPVTLERLRASLADRYRIERQLGQGGMATVYLAEDLKHHRKVAIKVLKSELAAVLGAERFLREIETTASLRHPHILPLFDSGAVDGLLYYVMPFVEGESLHDKLEREKQLPLEEALRIAREVADALSYAHGRGVIHRDIKPENILLESGHAVVADFGIAKAVATAGGEALTTTGMAIGTPRYMSPEQAAGGKDVDGRSDLYALGCVLYEMLAGQPPFTGPTAESVIRQHMASEPPAVSRLRPAVPPEIDGVVQRALAKAPADRFNPVAQFADALRPPAPVVVQRLPWRALGVAGAVLLAAAAVGIVWLLGRTGATPPGIVRTVQVTRDPGLEVDPALSPDGQLVAYAAGPPTRMQIYVRQVGGGRVIALTSDTSVNHRWPRWSPDGSRIAYQTGAGVEAVPALGGQPRLLVGLPPQPPESITTALTRLAGFSWSPDGQQIVYSLGFWAPGLVVAPLDGAAPRILPGIGGAHEPVWSPDGKWIACASGNPVFVFGSAYFGNEGAAALWLVPVGGGAPVRLTDDQSLNTSPAWSPDGQYLYWVSNSGGGRDIYRLRIDRDGPRGAKDRVTTGANAHTVTVSENRLAYASMRTLSNIWTIAVPAGGPVSIREARPVTTGTETIEVLDISPDGRQLVFDSDRNGNGDIYTMPAAGGEARQLTTDSAGDYSPAWSRDGKRIAFHSLRTGNRDIFTMTAEGQNLTQRTSSPAQELDADWSRGDSALVMEVFGGGGGHLSGIQVLPLEGGEPRLFEIRGDFARWAPVGGLIVFHGLDGLRLLSPRDSTSRLLVSTSAADGEPFYAAWSRDGRTVYYVSKSVTGSAIRSVPVAGGPSRLLVRFDDPTREHTRYGFATDGHRFYFTVGSHESDVWVADLARP